MPKFEDSFFKKEKAKFKPKKYRAWLSDDIATDVKLESNRTQTDVKPNSNQSQTDVKLESNRTQTDVKPNSNQSQTDVKLESNRTQTDVKPNSNQSQTDVKLESNRTQTDVKPNSNQSQTDVKLESNRTQTDVKPNSNQSQTDVKLESNRTQTDVKPNSNQSQTDVKLESKIRAFSSLSPLSKVVIEFIYNSILEDNKRETAELKITDVAKHCHTTVSGSKITINRLIQVYMLERTQYKAGKYGWSRYKLPYEIYKILQDKNKKISSPIYNSNTITTNINKYKTQNDQHRDNETEKDKLIAELQKQLELQNQKQLQSTHQPQPTAATSKKEQLTAYLNNHLSDINANNTTKTNPVTQDDHETWQKIDFSALTPFGFKKSHIKQIMDFNTGLTPQEVEDSIEHYAWALENRREEIKSYAPKNNPLRGLMGVLKNGNAWIEGSYQSPEELALELQIQAKRAQLERQQAKRDELFTIEFEMWYTELSPEAIKKIEATNQFKSLPIATFKKGMGSEMYRNMMKGYYRDKA